LTGRYGQESVQDELEISSTGIHPQGGEVGKRFMPTQRNGGALMFGFSSLMLGFWRRVGSLEVGSKIIKANNVYETQVTS